MKYPNHTPKIPITPGKTGGAGRGSLKKVKTRPNILPDIKHNKLTFKSSIINLLTFNLTNLILANEI